VPGNPNWFEFEIEEPGFVIATAGRQGHLKL
jgi:hypothetical protein